MATALLSSCFNWAWSPAGRPESGVLAPRNHLVSRMGGVFLPRRVQLGMKMSVHGGVPVGILSPKNSPRILLARNLWYRQSDGLALGVVRADERRMVCLARGSVDATEEIEKPLRGAREKDRTLMVGSRDGAVNTLLCELERPGGVDLAKFSYEGDTLEGTFTRVEGPVSTVVGPHSVQPEGCVEVESGQRMNFARSRVDDTVALQRGSAQEEQCGTVDKGVVGTLGSDDNGISEKQNMEPGVSHISKSRYGSVGRFVTNNLEIRWSNLLVGIKEVAAQDTERLFEWARDNLSNTGVEKIVAEDAKLIQKTFKLLKELTFPDLKKGVASIVALRVIEDPSGIPVEPPEWPKPQYQELSGMALLASDFQTLSSYSEYLKHWIRSWRVPLQLCYNSEDVASYFNRRPHLLLFRFLEVAAAFASVAFKMNVNGRNIRKARSRMKEENERLTFSLESAAALKDTLEGLGPTFVKVAQSLSTRPDIIGTETAKVLSELQDRLAPYPTEEAKALVELELGAPVSHLFSYLSEEPVAAASFGQVYRGRTVEGQQVAIKVQRPDLLFTVARDIYILRLGLGLIRKVAKINSDISVLADELGRGLFGELDYTLEGANAEAFRNAHSMLPYVKTPNIVWHLTTQRVLTMEWIDGYRPVDLQLMSQGETSTGQDMILVQEDEARVALDDLVKKGVECSLVQLLETGVLHADPHPGNFLYTEEGKVSYLDFGLLCRVEKRHQEAMLAVIAHLVNGEWAFLANDLGDMDVLKPTTDRFALRLALERAFGDGPGAVVKDGQSNINFGQVTGRLWQVALKFRLRLPPYYPLVLRSLASLEGIALAVDPEYKVFASAYPYVVKRLLTDNSRSTRRVLQSLVLNHKKEVRWERIASLLRTSRGESALAKDDRKGRPTVTGEATQGQISLSMLLAFALSRRGSCLRRVFVEADTRSLAQAFVSASMRAYRREVATIISEAFYRYGMKRLKLTQMRGYMRDTQARDDELKKTIGGLQNLEGVFGCGNSSPESLLKNQRLWFLLKVFAGRMQGYPLLRIRVAWTVILMICYAGAIALHRLAIDLSEKLLELPSTESSPSDSTDIRYSSIVVQ